MDHCRAELRAKLNLVRKQVKRTIKNAKDPWPETIKQDFCGHYSKPRQSRLLKDDGTTTNSDFETGKVFWDYFTKVFNNTRPTDNSVLDGFPQHETLENLGVTPTITEVRNATRKMANRKGSGKNKLPLEGYKYLWDDNFSHLYDVVVEFWMGNDDQPEFHKAKLCIIKKKEISAYLRATGQYVSLMWPLKLSV